MKKGNIQKPDRVAEALRSMSVEQPPESLRQKVMKIQDDAVKKVEEKKQKKFYS